MTTVLQKWGNSLALRIPSSFAKDIRLHQGSEVEVSLVEGKMVMEPKGKTKPSLAKMLKGITDTNRHSEQPYGGPKGREAW